MRYGPSKNKVKTLTFSRVNFQLFRQIQYRTLKKLSSGINEQNSPGRSLRIFFIKHKKFPLFEQAGKECRRSEWLSKDLLVRLKHRKEMQAI